MGVVVGVVVVEGAGTIASALDEAAGVAAITEGACWFAAAGAGAGAGAGADVGVGARRCSPEGWRLWLTADVAVFVVVVVVATVEGASRDG